MEIHFSSSSFQCAREQAQDLSSMRRSFMDGWKLKGEGEQGFSRSISKSINIKYESMIRRRFKETLSTVYVECRIDYRYSKEHATTATAHSSERGGL